MGLVITISLLSPVPGAVRARGDRESGQREIFLQDPDGYLLMVSEHIGERPIQSP